MTAMLSDQLHGKRDQLLELLRSFGSAVVAFSAGVDSAVVAKAAVLALGDRAVAVTGVSASLARGELEEARETAKGIGIRHMEVATREFARPEYVRNPPDRCYHCRIELHRELTQLCQELDVAVLLDGANADDQRDYRPGTRAALEHDVRSPLAECGFSKREVRELAHAWGLAVCDKPSAPCLASRVAYGEQVTEPRLAMIDQAEQFLRDRGFETCRVRYHRGDLARVEVPVDQFAALMASELRTQLVGHLNQLGFKFATLDLQGFRSGSLNVLVSPEQRSG